MYDFVYTCFGFLGGVALIFCFLEYLDRRLVEEWVGHIALPVLFIPLLIMFLNMSTIIIYLGFATICISGAFLSTHIIKHSLKREPFFLFEICKWEHKCRTDNNGNILSHYLDLKDERVSQVGFFGYLFYNDCSWLKDWLHRESGPCTDLAKMIVPYFWRDKENKLTQNHSPENVQELYAAIKDLYGYDHDVEVITDSRWGKIFSVFNDNSKISIRYSNHYWTNEEHGEEFRRCEIYKKYRKESIKKDIAFLHKIFFEQPV